MIGAQSFGGGPATLQLIRREMIDRRGWIKEDEFVRLWTLCTLVPGINLIAFAILAGRQLAGWRGVAATLTGMLLPSVLITTFLTAGFTSIQNLPVFHSMLNGIIPATAALMFVFVIQMGRPLVMEGLREGPPSLAVTLFFIAGTALLISVLHLPVWMVLLLAAAAGSVALSNPLPKQLAADKKLLPEDKE